VLRCKSFVIRRRPAQRGHLRPCEKTLLPAECSPMNFISLRVEPGDSFRLSYLSNQKAWQPVHASMETAVPTCASRVIPTIWLEQFGQLMDNCSTAYLASLVFTTRTNENGLFLSTNPRFSFHASDSKPAENLEPASGHSSPAPQRRGAGLVPNPVDGSSSLVN
jgi:hypothetical protein